MDLTALTRQAVQAARDAGEVICSNQNREVNVLHKKGGDTYASQVVTEVDRKAQDAILQILGPSCEEFDLAVLTEESEDDQAGEENERGLHLVEDAWELETIEASWPIAQAASVIRSGVWRKGAC